ncbi:MAG: hypothetical protein KJ626_05735 [Verrucomicrobia bacterium]|nr:hypothetical protein [Verrucomicrobiota bacterium]
MSTCFACFVCADALLSPELELSAGHDSNRFRAEETEGSFFVSASPSVNLTEYATDTTELNAAVRYSRIEYIESDFGSTESLNAALSLWRVAGPAEQTLSLALGSYTDGQMPDDDLLWMELSASASWSDKAGRTFSLAGRLGAAAYDTRETEGGDAQDWSYWKLSPGYYQPLTKAWSWAAGVHIEGNSSNESADEYDGTGVRSSLDFTPASPFRGGLSLRYVMRDYGEGFDETVTELETWAAYRMSVSIEFFGSLIHTSLGNSDAVGEYDVLLAQFGIRTFWDVDFSNE